jgi:hypothetical protein
MSPEMAPSGGWRMSAIPPLSGDKQTVGERVLALMIRLAFNRIQNVGFHVRSLGILFIPTPPNSEDRR